MLTQTFSYKGLGELCPIFSKMAFMFLLLFVAFASQEVNGQVIVTVVEIEGINFSSSSQSDDLAEKKVNIGIETTSLSEIYPNPFDTELTIQVAEADGLNYLSLTNEIGAVVWEQNVYAIPNKFFIESLDPGTYYLTLVLSSGSFTETLVYSP